MCWRGVTARLFGVNHFLRRDVSVGSLWADEGLYYPLAAEPYTPQHWFALGKADPAFRTKPQLALELVD